MKRKEALSQYKWNFSHIFANHDKWKEKLDSLDNIKQKISELKGKLDKLSYFRQYLKLDKQLNFALSKLRHYLLYADLDLTNLKFQDLSTLYTNKCKDIFTDLSWIEPELKKVGSRLIMKWINENEEMKVHLHEFELFFRLDKYILDEEKEKLLSQVSVSRSMSEQLYETLAYSDRRPSFIKYRGKSTELTSSLYSKILETSHPLRDQDLRYEVNQKWYSHFNENKHSFAKMYEGIIRSENEEAIIRGYGSALEIKLFKDNIPVKTYETLISIGEQNVNLCRNFINIKRRFFYLDYFCKTDARLKMAFNFNQRYNVDDAIKIIKSSLEVLGEEYLEKLNIALKPGRIDYYEDTNKRDGAYSSGGRGTDPVILMNWDDSIDSVKTLSHELGHSVHTLMTESYQTYPNTYYPIILAEVASTLNEHLLFDYLYKKTRSREKKLFLLQSRIEEIIGTFFRQIQFAKFELEAHKLVEKNVPLNADVLSDLFRKIDDEFGGDALDKKEPEKKFYHWPYISHFFGSPYYVYKYALAIVASFKLYQDVKDGNTKNALNLLKSGGHKDPLEILKDAGVDLNRKNVYQPLISNLKRMIKEAGKLSLG